jgi:glutamate-1-semialdehyde 2,1-aminomutase
MRVAELLARELERFERANPRSLALAREAADSLLAGVPMPWMIRWPGGFPVFAADARGARFRDVDGHEYVDFCLGDTAAMTGHSPEPTVRAIAEQARRGITLMLPSEDAIWVGRELARRFGLPRWQFALTATDANRFAIRLAREGNVGPPVALAETTRVVEWNDVEALERELAHGDVACVLAEPALTNIGIVLPEPGFHDALREATRAAGTLLIIDETHTICAGPGGYTAAHGLEPDLLTIGKPIAGGVPAAAYGFSAEVADRLEELMPRDERADTGGIGGTVAANVLSLAATRATLAEVLTEEAFEHMIALGERFEAGVAEVIERHDLRWHVTRLGCRVEYLFRRDRPRNGSEGAAGGDAELDRLIHLYALNRGILLTPFHNMALMSPATTEADVDLHTKVFEEAAGELAAR